MYQAARWKHSEKSLYFIKSLTICSLYNVVVWLRFKIRPIAGVVYLLKLYIKNDAAAAA